MKMFNNYILVIKQSHGECCVGYFTSLNKLYTAVMMYIEGVFVHEAYSEPICSDFKKNLEEFKEKFWEVVTIIPTTENDLQTTQNFYGTHGNALKVFVSDIIYTDEDNVLIDNLISHVHTTLYDHFDLMAE